MLKHLTIKNYALIEELEVDFGRGLNIITGETGAGKSIIIDAFSLILGDRADADTVRKDAAKAVVEAVFDVADNTLLSQVLTANDIDDSGELIVRREVSSKGQSRCFINDSPSTIGLLKGIGDLLVDLHGQHDHQALLRSDTHLGLLDEFGNLSGLIGEYRLAYEDVRTTVQAIDELASKRHELESRRALYEFQMKEIDAIAPQDGEDERLEAELKILENSERLYSATERLYQLLYDGESAIHDQLVLVRNQLEDLASIDPVFGESRNEASSAIAIVGEMAKLAQQYNAKIEFSPERLDTIRERLGHLTLLKKKYGGSLSSVLQLRKVIGHDFDLAENFSGEIARLEEAYVGKRNVCSELAERLTSKRHDVARKVSSSIEQSLKTLGISNSRFEVKIERSADETSRYPFVKLGEDPYQAGSTGIDRVEFHLSTNAGEEVKPLVKVASGGEVSRIMLAMKMILAKSDRLPLLVFDEIDVGISGRIAQAVGRALKKLSQFHQIIAITHLPQIAGVADTHFVVEKREEGKRSSTHMRDLELDERVVEVAKLMSGAEVTESGRRSAKELMGLR